MPDIYNILLKYFKKEDLKKSGDNYITRCPFHDDKSPSFGVHALTGSWNCFGCGAKGRDIFSLVAKLENIDYNKAYDILDGTNQEKDPRKKIKNHLEKYLVKDTPLIKESSYFISGLPKGFFLYDETNVPAYLTNRLSLETIKYFSMGACKNNDYLDNRAIIPITLHNEVISYGARRMDTIKECKYLYRAGFPLNKYLFNYDNLSEEYPYCILMEGVFSVMSAHEKGLKNVLGVFSAKETSNEQLKLLLDKKFIKTVILCYDNDDHKSKAGNVATEKCITKLLSFYDIEIMRMPSAKDANDVDEATLNTIFESRESLKKILKKSWRNHG